MWKTLLLLGLLFLSPAIVFATVGTFVVTEKEGDGFLVQDAQESVWFIESSYCSVYEGDAVYIDTIGSEPSTYGDLLRPGGFTDTTCSIDDVFHVTHRGYIDEVFDSEDKVILSFAGTRYLVEYGTGCSRMWRYEDRKVYLDIGGSSLDGVGDAIVLPSGDSCRVWNAESIGNGSEASGFDVLSKDIIKTLVNLRMTHGESSKELCDFISQTTENLNKLLPMSTEISGKASIWALITTLAMDGKKCPAKQLQNCPTNAHIQNGTCFCNDGFVADPTKVFCVRKVEKMPVISPPLPATTGNTATQASAPSSRKKKKKESKAKPKPTRRSVRNK